MSHPQQPNSLDRKAKIILTVFGLVASAITLELAFRLFTGLAKPHQWTDRPYAYLLPEGTDSAQDVPRSPKAPGTFRIAVVGDSFSFGPLLQLPDTFSKKLEWMLNLNSSAPRVEVLNRGVCGASTRTEVEIVKHVLLEKPDLLILEITLNDAEPRILTPKRKEALFGAPWLSWKIFSWWRSLGFIATRLHNSITVRKYIDYHSKFFKDPESFAQFDRALGSITSLSKEAHVPLMAVVFPLFDFPIDARYPFHEVHDIIASTAARYSIPLMDLRTTYMGIPPERLQVAPGLDSHPNEIAHRIAAERLLAILIDKKLLPSAAIPRHVVPRRAEVREHPTNRKMVFRKAARATNRSWNAVVSTDEKAAPMVPPRP